jgi:hypothetical protein
MIQAEAAGGPHLDISRCPTSAVVSRCRHHELIPMRMFHLDTLTGERWRFNDVYPARRSRIPAMWIAVRATVLMLFLCCLSLAQEHPAAQRVFLNLPKDLRSEDIFIRYQIITDKGRDAQLIRPHPGVHQYVLPLASSLGGKPQLANIVVYSPGCQFKIYVVDISGPADPAEDFLCETLPTKHMMATLPAAEIPKNILYKVNPSVEVIGYLDGDWICSYFLRIRPDNEQMLVGSCLGTPVFLGVMGVINPTENGSFQLDIPDFTRDPTYKDFGRRNYGSMAFLLRDPTAARIRGLLRVESAADGEDYHIPVDKSFSGAVSFSTKSTPAVRR